MSNTIGEVNINLRMSLAQFKQDTKQGTQEVSRNTQQMAKEISAQSHEAKASLALIGEEMGVTIPRHIRGLIASVPGVGSALAAAFSSVAVLALVQVIVEVVRKIQEWREKTREAAEAWQTLGEMGKDTLYKLDTQLLQIQKRIDELKDNHVAALRDELALVNRATMEGITSEFQKIGKATDDVFAKAKVGWFENLVGMGKNDAITQVQQSFDRLIQTVERLKASGDTIRIGQVLKAEMDDVKASLATFEKWGGGNEAIRKAMEGELATLQSLDAAYGHFQTVAENTKAADKMQEQKRATEETRKELEKLNSEMEKLESELQKFETRHNVIGQSLGVGNIDPTGIFHAGDVLQKGPQSSSLPPVYGGTKEASDLYKITVDQNAAIAAAQKIYTGTRTATEQYANEMAVLNELLKQGKIDQDTYNRAAAEAKAKADTNAKAIQQFGQSVGETLKQAVLFGKGWKDAFGSIAIELTQLLLKMTLLKSLGAASSGGGGFFSSLLTGLAGKFAGGGDAFPGKEYLVGEDGPEIFSTKTRGQIIPIKAGGADGGRTQVNNYAFTFNGVTDMDSFKRSQGQIAAQMAGELTRHQRRNG